MKKYYYKGFKAILPFLQNKNIHVITRTHHLKKEVDRLGFLSFK